MDANLDIGLLLAVSFLEKSIVRNSRIAGKWGKEEKTIPYFPFTAGESFKVILLIRMGDGYIDRDINCLRPSGPVCLL